ncbi:MAG: TonB-dependent receptor [Novosphingobium sp.]|nr:TonB-dependent receptor [Novosphingobium sp.]
MAQEQSEAGASADDVIIVTAQRRAERTQDVPISITSMSSEALEQANVEQLGDIAKLSPATRFDYNSNFVQPTIRGVGTAVVQSGGGANVGIYTDGFYSPNPLAADFQLLSLESIQVLKGPQGTLFGRNTTGGAILVTTAKPSFDTRAIVDLSYGSFNTARAQAYVSSGLGEAIAVDLEGSYAVSDGYVRNLAPNGDPDIGGYKNWSVRAGLRFDVSDSVSFVARYIHQSVDDGTNLATGILVQDGITYANPLVKPPAVPDALFPDAYRQVSLTEPVGFRFNSDIFQLTGEFDLGFADLVSYTQYRDERGTNYLDQDQTYVPIVSVLIPIVDKTFTQELLMTSKSGERLSWTAGAFYFRYKDTYDNVALSLGGGDFFPYAASTSTTESIAAYLDVTYEIVDRLFLTGGARYSHDKFGDPYQFFLGLGEFFPDAVSKSRVTPRAVLRYELSDDASVYASFSRGYKSELIDLARVTGPAPVAAEKITAYEAGLKYATRALSFNVAAWYYDYSDLQVSSYLPIPGGGSLSRIDNASDARIYGVEGDVRFQVTSDFSISAAGAYVNAKYRNFTASNRFDPVTLAPILPFDSSGLQMQRAPEFTGTLSASYGIDLGGGRLNLSGNLYYTSKVYFDASEQFRQDGYELLGLRADWTDPSDTLTLAVYGNNLTGSKYLKQFNTGGFGAGWGEPRTWGVSLRYDFGG